MSDGSPKQFHEKLFGFIVAGVLVSLISWAIQRMVEHGEIFPSAHVAQPAAPSGASEPQPNGTAGREPSTQRDEPLGRYPTIPGQPVNEIDKAAEDMRNPPSTVSSPSSGAVQAPKAPNGKITYNRQVAVFGGGFYGADVPLTLESVENDPNSSLALHFLVENRGDADYRLSLSRPREMTLAIDDKGSEYSFLSAEEIDSVPGLMLLGHSRKRFVVNLRPLQVFRDSLRLQLLFEHQRGQNSGFSAGPISPVTQNVEVLDIPISHLSD
jgi:hypothetical protein